MKNVMYANQSALIQKKGKLEMGIGMGARLVLILDPNRSKKNPANPAPIFVPNNGYFVIKAECV